MQRRTALLAALAALTATSPLAAPARARAAPPEVLAELPGAMLRGSGRLRFAGLRIYDVRLWSATPVTADNWGTTPLALELEYARSLAGRRIAERSIVEMQRQQNIDAPTAERWQRALAGVFPDVHNGDRITGFKRPELEPAVARFYVNARFAGEIAEAGFAPLFFGIWLAPQTSEPEMRAQLLELSP